METSLPPRPLRSRQMVMDEPVAAVVLLLVLQTQLFKARPHAGHRRPDSVE